MSRNFSFSPLFPILWYISNGGSTEDQCPSKRKSEGREPDGQKSHLVCFFSPHCFDFLGGSNVGTQQRDSVSSSVLLLRWRLFLLPCASSSLCRRILKSGGDFAVLTCIAGHGSEASDMNCSVLPRDRVTVVLNSLRCPLMCVF